MQSDFNCDSKSPRFEQSLIICVFFFCWWGLLAVAELFQWWCPIPHSAATSLQGCPELQTVWRGVLSSTEEESCNGGKPEVERPRPDNGQPLTDGRTELNNRTSVFVSLTANWALNSLCFAIHWWLGTQSVEKSFKTFSTWCVTLGLFSRRPGWFTAQPDATQLPSSVSFSENTQEKWLKSDSRKLYSP